VVGGARIGTAMSVDTVASSGTRMVGPLLGGTLYAAAGMDGVFLLTASAYGLALVVLLGLPRVPSHGPSAGKVFEKIRDGLRDLKRLPVLQAVLAVTVVFNVWGFPVISMVPVVGAEGLALAPFEIGVLASMEGLGSLLGALLLATLARQGRYRQLYFIGVAVYLVAATLFAHSVVATLTGALLLVMGLSMAAFAAMQSVLVLLNAPPSIRPRMMGLLSVCIGSGPIGLAHIGLMSAWFGAATACSIVAVEGLVALGIVVARWPALLARQAEA
jgi:predicted MFS family arabinose efflux permease